MIKKKFFFFIITTLVLGLSCCFLFVKKRKLLENQISLYDFPSQNIYAYYNKKVPYTGCFFVGFKEAIAFKESQGVYHKINTIGHIGKYQFSASTLKSVGVTDVTHFLTNEALQEKAFIALLSQNKWYLRHQIKAYSGKIMAGIYITESGILAAAHLGGAKSVKIFLKSGGKRVIKDQYGTSIKKYMYFFSGYDTSMIPANKNARAQ